MEIQQLIEHDELINYLPHKGKNGPIRVSTGIASMAPGRG